MDTSIMTNDLSAVLEADKKHVWHHLIQHKMFETIDPRVIVEGKGLGRSAHASVITRGFAELTRFAVALGARAETLNGLCGLGDLVLTCSSPQSRNMSVGLALGQGLTLEQALAGKLSVAEGVASAPAVRALARKLGVEVPICEAVAAILDGEMAVDAAIAALLARPLKSEGF